MTANTAGAQVVAPFWVKMVRSGNTFSGYSSPDGTTWTLVGSATISMASTVSFGLALTSHDNAQLCTAKLDNVAASGGAPTPTRTPTRTPTPTPGGPFLLRIEAEAGALTAPMAAASVGTAFGGQYIVTSTTDAGTAAWTFSVPSAGTYYVWSRVLSATEKQDSFYVKMDSGAEDVYDTAQGTWSPNWQWTRLNGRGGTGMPLTINPRTFSLSAGSHTLTFRGRETSTLLDRIIVTTDASFVPTETP